jgi:hypothetical protein
MFPEDLINQISALQRDHKKINKTDLTNPVAGLLTPEWYYSDSVRIFSDVGINWETIGGFDLIQRIADTINEITVNNLENDGVFESTFCSWYQSYHYEPVTKWGVHIRYYSWLRLAAYFNHTCPNLKSNPISSAKAAFLYLFVHALFHYMTENAASIIEIILQDSCIYTHYISSIYAEVFNTRDCLEEALANSYLLSRCDLCHIDRRYLEKELLKQGPGYSDFVDYVESKFSYGVRRLISQIRSGKINPPSYLPIEQIMITSNSSDHPYGHMMPIWLHQRARPLRDEYSNKTFLK